MPTWPTHLMIADRLLDTIPGLDRQAFCIGNIAPDCNVENEDWTHFEPSREITHWMSSDNKTLTDCDRFYKKYVEDRMHEIHTEQELSFLLGYCAHLIADAEFQRYNRDPQRVKASWVRIKNHPCLSNITNGMPETWDSVKEIIIKSERMMDINTIEAEYLEAHSNSGYLTEVMGLEHFPDYIDYLPSGAIVRKIRIMAHMPEKAIGKYPFIAVTREEYGAFLDNATEQIGRYIITHRALL